MYLTLSCFLMCMHDGGLNETNFSLFLGLDA